MTENYKLMHGDCLELMKDIPSGSVDAVITDPPYGMSYQSNWRQETNKFNKIEGDSCLYWLGSFISDAYRVMKENTPIYVFCSWHNVDVFKVEIEKLFKIKNIIVWVKNNHGSGDLRGSYAPKHEFIIFAHKGRFTLLRSRTPDVIDFRKVSGSKSVHPTEKPVDMLEKIVLDATLHGKIVLDPFMGSGTTGVACMNTGRKFIGIEMDDKYFEIASKRISEACCEN